MHGYGSTGLLSHARHIYMVELLSRSIAVTRSSQLVKSGVTQSIMKSNAWAADKFSNAYIALLSLPVCCSKSITPTNLSTLFSSLMFAE